MLADHDPEVACSHGDRRDLVHRIRNAVACRVRVREAHASGQIGIHQQPRQRDVAVVPLDATACWAGLARLRRRRRHRPVPSRSRHTTPPNSAGPGSTRCAHPVPSRAPRPGRAPPCRRDRRSSVQCGGRAARVVAVETASGVEEELRLAPGPAINENLGDNRWSDAEPEFAALLEQFHLEAPRSARCAAIARHSASTVCACRPATSPC